MWYNVSGWCLTAYSDDRDRRREERREERGERKDNDEDDRDKIKEFKDREKEAQAIKVLCWNKMGNKTKFVK